ncbi:MAG: GntR family transcriptional regulator [Solobacterium sp.]|nr:GntR family transcriptional regulator [Solobacterium sp.]
MTVMLEKKTGQKPLWSQLYEILRERIEQNRYPEGMNLPTESELMSEFSLSRVTIRKAMERLMNEGYIIRRRGSGTIINPRRRNTSTTLQTTIIGEFNDRRDRRVISVSYEIPPAAASSFFGTPERQPVLTLVRRLYVEGKPVSNHKSYLNPTLGIDDRMDFNGSLYETLSQAGYPITEITERFTSSLSDKEEEQLLELKEPKVIMRRQRSGSCGKIPVEYSLVIYIADDYELTVRYRK